MQQLFGKTIIILLLLALPCSEAFAQKTGKRRGSPHIKAREAAAKHADPNMSVNPPAVAIPEENTLKAPLKKRKKVVIVPAPPPPPGPDVIPEKR